MDHRRLEVPQELHAFLSSNKSHGPKHHELPQELRDLLSNTSDDHVELTDHTIQFIVDRIVGLAWSRSTNYHAQD